MESEDYLQAQAGDDMTGRYGKIEPKRKWFTVKLSIGRADTGVQIPGKPRLSGSAMQRTAVDGCTHAKCSSKLGDIIFVQAAVEIPTEKITSQLDTVQAIVILPMG